VVVVFLNSFVDLGHKIIIQNTLFKAYDGPSRSGSRRWSTR
jgi:acyl-[acyl-carrier-protein]-phospholipid O-acyltransferase/long-chain-fatty-acid--[acyl-carrier-protein] ligase